MCTTGSGAGRSGRVIAGPNGNRFGRLLLAPEPADLLRARCHGAQAVSEPQICYKGSFIYIICIHHSTISRSTPHTLSPSSIKSLSHQRSTHHEAPEGTQDGRPEREVYGYTTCAHHPGAERAVHALRDATKGRQAGEASGCVGRPARLVTHITAYMRL